MKLPRALTRPGGLPADRKRLRSEKTGRVLIEPFNERMSSL
ncbi:MAG TPA: hypothetical protein VE135_00580 [Pyrinomonadaceae bacterium]|nr:hypothetical protein [Pyrinomonadaceae bacterium]